MLNELLSIFIVYRPPDSSRIYENISCHDYMSDIILGIECNISTKGLTIIVRDFNYPDVILEYWFCTH